MWGSGNKECLGFKGIGVCSSNHFVLSVVSRTNVSWGMIRLRTDSGATI